jgi:molybdopterin adenylyltransferase
MDDQQTLLIGLVSISDRASAGVYQDQGIPGLTIGSTRRSRPDGGWRPVDSRRAALDQARSSG